MSLVLELNSHHLRFGKGGDVKPEILFSSHYGTKRRATGSPLKRKRTSNGEFTFGNPHSLLAKHNDLDIKSIFQHNQVREWQAVEAIFEHLLCSSSRMKTTTTTTTMAPSKAPLLLVEPLRTDRRQQQHMVEILFEKCAVPALGSMKCTSAGVFANGRTSALALDMGHSFTSVVPVKDGFTDESKLFRTELAGAVMTEATLELLRANVASRHGHSNVFNEALGTNDFQSQSQRLYGALEVASQWKEHFCSCIPVRIASSTSSTSSPSSSSSSSSSSPPPPALFTLPDGTQITSSAESGTIVSELLFDPNLENFFDSAGIKQPIKFTGHLMNNISRMESVGKILFQSLTQFDADTKRAMWENIVLFGGTSTAVGMADRVRRELIPLLPGKATVKIIETKVDDRAISSWIGGSIVASTLDFESNLCLTKSNYEEEGLDRALMLQEMFQ